MTMTKSQSGILADVPPAARYLEYALEPGAELRPALSKLCDAFDCSRHVLGLGQSTCVDLGLEIPGLETFPSFADVKVAVPNTTQSLWIWLRGSDRGDLYHQGAEVANALYGAFRLVRCVDGGRDTSPGIGLNSERSRHPGWSRRHFGIA